MGEPHMQIADILKNAGESVVRNVVPGGGLLMDLIESFTGESVDRNATGEQLLKSLPPEILLRQIDTEHDTIRTMLNAPQVTRPKIALGAFHVYGVIILVVVSMWSYGVLAHKPELIAAVVDGWPWLLSLTGPLTTLLMAYFGVVNWRTEYKPQSILSKLFKK